MKQLLIFCAFSLSISAMACPERHEASQTTKKESKSSKEILVASREKNKCQSESDCAAFETCSDGACAAGIRCQFDSECGTNGSCIEGTCF